MARMSNTEIAAIVQNQVQLAAGANTTELDSLRADALKYYYGFKRGDEVAGCSQVISSDVADMLEAVVATMMPALESGGVVQFIPQNENDIDQAQIESQAVNYFVMNENNGYIYIQEAVRDALLLRNGITKVWIDEQIDVKTESFKELTPMEYVGLVNMPVDENTQIEVVSESLDADTQTIDLTLRVTVTKKNLKVDSVDPAVFFYTPNYQSICLDKIPLCGEVCFWTRSDLIQMGFDKKTVNELQKAAIQNQTNQARNQDGGTQGEIYNQAADQSQEIVQCYEVYIRMDVEGKGVSELRKIILSGNVVLSNEPWEFVPYATGTPFLQPHRVTGIGLYDKLKVVQDIKTATLRQWIDNFSNGNQGRVWYLKGAVNLDELANPRPAGMVGVDSPNAIGQLPNLDIGGSAANMMGYMDKMRSERGGASLDLQTSEAQIMGQTAQGIERQYSVREMLAAMMCRTIAETLIAGTYLNVHRTLRLFKGGEVMFQASGQFQKTNPEQWPERYRVNIASGISIGERNRKQAALVNTIQQQQALFQAGMGGIMCNLSGYYAAITDLAQVSGIDSPERYFIDPKSPESQQAQKQQQATQQQQQQMMQQQQQMLVMMQKQLAEQQMQLDKYKADQKTRFDYDKLHQDGELKEAEIVSSAATTLQKSEIDHISAITKAANSRIENESNENESVAIEKMEGD